MCHPLILGSVKPLPISKYVPDQVEDGWNIYVTSIGQAISLDARAIFSTRDLYYIYARHTGDACGFWGHYEEARDAREELAVFLERSLELVADLQLYVAETYFGKSGVMPTNLKYIGPSDIRTWLPGFLEGDFFQVIREE